LQLIARHIDFAHLTQTIDVKGDVLKIFSLYFWGEDFLGFSLCIEVTNLHTMPHEYTTFHACPADYISRG